MPKLRCYFLLPMLIAMSLVLSGCSPVAPWQRGTLAKPQMAASRSELAATMRSHNYGSREAASGSGSSGGGGCGCY